MGIEAIGAIVLAVMGIIATIIKLRTNRKANRNEIGKVESKELLDGMDAVDRAAPTSPRVQPPEQPR